MGEGMPFTADQVIANVLALAPDSAGYWVAYSGGLDSHVLLHALAAVREQLPAPLVAVHVNHNLQSAAADWDAHCRAVCADLNIEYRSLSVDARHANGESPEAAARAARYRAITELLPAGQVLLTAHHQDDQAETLLLQLLRGAGPKGLAAMPESSALGQGRLLRPLLAVSRAELQAYAEQQELRWIEDPSNAQLDYDRNYLRHNILPLLQQRWPATSAVLARGARHQADAAQLLYELAAIDLQDNEGHSSTSRHSVIPTQAGIHVDTLPTAVLNPGLRRDDDSVETGQRSISSSQTEAVRGDHLKSGSDPCLPLSVSTALTLSAPRRANLLRHWLHRCGAPVPSAAILARIEQDVLRAGMDAMPCVAWGSVCVRRYRDQIFVDSYTDTAGKVAGMLWAADQPVSLAGGVLSPEPGLGVGVARRHLADRPLRIEFRRGGERLQPAGRREHHTLKHLFQDAGVPPWERARVPLLYQDEALIAVAGYWVCEGFQAAVQEPGVRFNWSRAIVPDGSFW